MHAFLILKYHPNVGWTRPQVILELKHCLVAAKFVFKRWWWLLYSTGDSLISILVPTSDTRFVTRQPVELCAALPGLGRPGIVHVRWPLFTYYIIVLVICMHRDRPSTPTHAPLLDGNVRQPLTLPSGLWWHHRPVIVQKTLTKSEVEYHSLFDSPES